MGEHKVNDPVLVSTFESDDKGRITLGKEYGNSKISIVVEEVNEAK